ncbi:MAG: hypothetical protein Q8N04_04705 [Nitrospira sp.]|nr:hypothetical protein [Nitrospira sp.]
MRVDLDGDATDCLARITDAKNQTTTYVYDNRKEKGKEKGTGYFSGEAWAG